MEMISNWKVILPTPLDSEVKEDKDGKFYCVYHHTPYEFTVAEALEYICRERWSLYMFEKMMLHNTNLRDAMRSFGVKKVVNQLRVFAPDNKGLVECFDDFIDKHPDGSIGNLDIQVYPITEDVKILGHTFHGLEDTKAYSEISLYTLSISNGPADRLTPKKRGKVHVGEVWQSYPCFDSSDYATETRCYQNYVIRNRPITNEDLKTIEKQARGCLEVIKENMRIDTLPIVYYRGDGGFMLVATPRT